MGFFSALFFLLSLFFLLPFCVLRNLWLKKLTFLTTANNPDGGRIQEDTYLLFPCASFPFFCSLSPFLSYACHPTTSHDVPRRKERERKKEKRNEKYYRKPLPAGAFFAPFFSFSLPRPGQASPSLKIKGKDKKETVSIIPLSLLFPVQACNDLPQTSLALLILSMCIKNYDDPAP